MRALSFRLRSITNWFWEISVASFWRLFIIPGNIQMKSWNDFYMFLDLVRNYLLSIYNQKIPFLARTLTFDICLLASKLLYRKCGVKNILSLNLKPARDRRRLFLHVVNWWLRVTVSFIQQSRSLPEYDGWVVATVGGYCWGLIGKKNIRLSLAIYRLPVLCLVRTRMAAILLFHENSRGSATVPFPFQSKPWKIGPHSNSRVTKSELSITHCQQSNCVINGFVLYVTAKLFWERVWCEDEERCSPHLVAIGFSTTNVRLIARNVLFRYAMFFTLV